MDGGSGGLNPRDQTERLIQLTLQSPTPLTVARRLYRPVYPVTKELCWTLVPRPLGHHDGPLPPPQASHF